MMNTKYAPADRYGIEKVLDQRSSIDKIENIKGLLSSLSYIVFILNAKRQIVFANDLLLKKLNLNEELGLVGARAGEVLSCLNSNCEEGGCGTSEHCKYCDVINVILDVSNKKLPCTREARVLVRKGKNVEQLDLELTASPLNYADEDFVVLSAMDVTDKKRKELLERIFFHDIINLAGSLDGIMEMMDDMSCDDRHRFLKSAKRLSNSLVDEIVTQQELVKAENNELHVHPEAYELSEIIEDAISGIEHHNVAKNKHIEFVTKLKDEGIITDKVLFKRVLINMIKNALEASNMNDKVVVSSVKHNGNIRILVNNQTFMPENVQCQIFQRSFSTKESGRGIGTYSMKLLGERYLKGKVGFTTDLRQGTTFYLDVPVILKA